jgi:glutathione S-transferase
MVPAQLVFYDWPYSPFCMKVREILDYKGIKYEAVNPRDWMSTIRQRGRIGKVPALEIDGEMIVDSTDIAYALDARFPNPPLLPHDSRQRALCHMLEDWADESLYFIGLYYRWYEAEGRKPIPLVFGNSLRGRLVYRIYLRRILGQIRGQGTLRKPMEHVRRDLDRHLNAIEALLKPGPYLLGDKPYLCDFALRGQLRYLDRTPVGGKAIEAYAGIRRYLLQGKAPVVSSAG